MTLTLARYSVDLAADPADVRAAQRLRHQVFAEELGARLTTPEPGLDIDPFDELCDHLLVRDESSVVGTYRLLPPGRTPTLYSDTEFDLSALASIRSSLVETGRSCVHPDHRDGAVVGLMWAGIARYMVESGHGWLAGCCSVSLSDGGALAAGVWDRVREKYLSPPEFAVTPHRPWPVAEVSREDRGALPALLRGYLRLGAWVCGPPAYDAEFGVADFFVLLSAARVDARYIRHFLGGSA